VGKNIRAVKLTKANNKASFRRIKQTMGVDQVIKMPGWAAKIAGVENVNARHMAAK
jgi:hypothetical protein